MWFSVVAVHALIVYVQPYIRYLYIHHNRAHVLKVECLEKMISYVQQYIFVGVLALSLALPKDTPCPPLEGAQRMPFVQQYVLRVPCAEVFVSCLLDASIPVETSENICGTFCFHITYQQ